MGDDQEKNRREDSLMEAQLTTIAEICLDAPTKIKDVIGRYDPCNSTDTLVFEFSTFSKDEVTDALEYLGVKMTWKDYLKPNCVLELINRIRNLLPTRCGTCDELYATHREDFPILPCEKCGNEPHKTCLALMLGIDSHELSSEIVKTTLNPTGFECMHYICHQCLDEALPGKKSGMTKCAIKRHERAEQQSSGKNPKKKASVPNKVTELDESSQRENTSSTPTTKAIHENELEHTVGEHSSQIPSGSKDSPSIIPSSMIENNLSGMSDEQAQQGGSPPVKNELDTSAIKCRNYMKGNCRHGISGKTGGTCKYYHPKPCSKLMLHGTKAGKGCNKGKLCESFHPKMCPMSLAKRACYSNHCNLKHVRGTKRIQPKDKTKDPKNKEQNNHEKGGKSEPTKNQDFLKALHDMQTDIMKSVEEKLSAITGALKQMQSSMLQTQFLPAHQPQLQMLQLQQQQKHQPFMQTFQHQNPQALYNQQVPNFSILQQPPLPTTQTIQS